MTTANEAYNQAPPRERISLYGQLLFLLETATAAPPEGPAASVRLSSLGWTPVSTLTEAVALHAEYVQRWQDEGLRTGDLASSIGYVADRQGHISHWISHNGQVHKVLFLGRSGQPLATEPLLALTCNKAADERDNGAPYFSCEADDWLQGRSLADAAPRPR
jgi:hypothetical protein